MSNTMIAVAAGIGLLAAGGAVYAATNPRTDGRLPGDPLIFPQPPPTGVEALVPASVLEAIIARRRRNGQPLIAPPSAAPPSAIEKPIRGRLSTPWGTGTNREAYYTAPGAARTLANVRAILSLGNRADIDARCYYALISQECGPIGRSCWHYNIGNYKANTKVWATPEMIRAGRVLVPGSTRPGITGVWCVTDRVHSNDLYFCYDGFANGVADHFRLFEWSNYRGVIEGYRAGGLNGLIQAESALARGGYSGATTVERTARAQRYWAMHTQLLGDLWVR
jgi:hypothetical protein